MKVFDGERDGTSVVVMNRSEDPIYVGGAGANDAPPTDLATEGFQVDPDQAVSFPADTGDDLYAIGVGTSPQEVHTLKTGAV